MAKSKKAGPDRHDILAELRRREMTLTALAKLHGRNPASFRHIWTRPNAINEAIVAEFLGRPVEEIFPDRYPKKTTRILSHEYLAESTARREAA